MQRLCFGAFGGSEVALWRILYSMAMALEARSARTAVHHEDVPRGSLVRARRAASVEIFADGPDCDEIARRHVCAACAISVGQQRAFLASEGHWNRLAFGGGDLVVP